MQRRAFINELKVVVSYLWRSPYITGTVRTHLLSYFKDVEVRIPDVDKQHYESVLITEPNGYQHIVKYKTECHKYITDLCYVMDLLIDTYFVLWGALEDYGEYDAIRIKRIMRGWISKISTWPISIYELGVVCKTYTEEFLRPYADTEDGLPNRVTFGVLNARLRSLSPNLHWFLHPLRGVIEAWSKSGDVNLFRILYQCGEYILRGKSISLDLVTQQKADYIAFEEGLKTRRPEADVLHQLKVVSALCLPEDLESSFRAQMVPKHSAGATALWARGVSLVAKHTMVHFDKKLLKVLPELAPFAVFSSYETTGLKPAFSEIVNVPKNLLKDRLISKEETTTQYAQHAVQKGMVYLFNREDLLFAKHIDLAHAEKNGRLAALGSIQGEYATVDLSNASDSVSVFHIHQLPRWLRRMLSAVRCPVTSFKGTLVPLLKYAPMGSATCFPTECLIFFFAALIAIVRYHRLSFGNLTIDDLRRLAAHSNFRIYGDDIVIEHKYVSDLYDVLDELLFTVNRRKSYTQLKVSTFRESCGFEFLNGIDVAPLRTARKRGRWQNRISTADQLSQIVEYHNNCALKGLFPLLRVWRWRLKHTKVAVRLQRRMVFVPVLGHIPYVHIDDYVGGLQLITYSCPTNHDLWAGGLDTVTSAYQRSRYWGFSVRKSLDKEADRKEIQKLVSFGYSPAEPDICRWVEYWISVLSSESYDTYREHDSKGLCSFEQWNSSHGLYAREKVPTTLRCRYTVEMTPVYK